MGIAEGGLPKGLHILDVYRASLLYPPIDNKDRSGTGKKYDESDPDCQIIPPATQLQEAGIQFERSKTNSFTDVSFDPRRGMLSLPHVVVDDDTEPSLLNVMAFEKLHVSAGNKVTSFVMFISNLIDMDKDVTLLASEKIMTNALGNDHSAAELFSMLGRGAYMDLDSHITRVQKMVNEHCNKTWNKWCASLKQDYFQSPWAMISLVAALLGFVVLLLQAIYQFLDYYLK